MEDCIFCKIVKGEIPCAKVYENEGVLVFLDVNPISKGHALVIPKTHFQDVFDIDKTILEKITVEAKQVAEKMKEVLHVDGINFLQSNGVKAGQVVFHYHMHIIPRYENDRLEMRPVWVNKDPELKSDSDLLNALAKKLK